VLAKNYLDFEMHPMFDAVERLMGETKITPADVAENLMPKSPTDDEETCLSNLVQALEEAKEKGAKKEEAAEKEHEDGKEKDTTVEDAVESQVDEEAK